MFYLKMQDSPYHSLSYISMNVECNIKIITIVFLIPASTIKSIDPRYILSRLANKLQTILFLTPASAFKGRDLRCTVYKLNDFRQ